MSIRHGKRHDNNKKNYEKFGELSERRRGIAHGKLSVLMLNVLNLNGSYQR